MLSALEFHYRVLTLTLMEYGKQKQCKSSASSRQIMYLLLIQNTNEYFVDPILIIIGAKTNNHSEQSDDKVLNRTAEYKELTRMWLAEVLSALQHCRPAAPIRDTAL